MDRKTYLELFVVSAVLLYMELAAIRFFGSTVMFLTFFTNIILLACFLGMSLGCLGAHRKQNYMNWTIPLLLLTCLATLGLSVAYVFDPHFFIDVGNQRSPQFVFFGAEHRDRSIADFVIPIELIGGAYFVLIALTFIGPGQVMGRAFNAIANPVLGYTANIAGSLFGILLFVLTSYFHLPPLIWFSACLLPCFYWINRFKPLQVICLLPILLLMAFANFHNPAIEVYWSPYYQIVYLPKRKDIFTNNLSHQEMHEVVHSFSFYALPYLLKSSVEGVSSPFRDVLIIGAGSGNDVASALDHEAAHVDAVEIDPVIAQLGRRAHPDKPFADPRVSLHLDDGRNFVRRCAKQYDLAVYALVDSLVLHSGFSNLRLESYLFTKQALESIKERLKPGGIFVMYNYYRQDWIAARLAAMAKEVFGNEPLLLTLSDPKSPPSNEFDKETVTFVLVSNGPSSALDAIHRKFKEGQFFWLNDDPSFNKTVDGFGEKAPALSTGANDKGWTRVQQVKIPELPSGSELPSDSWPFLYLKNRLIPDFNIRGMAVMAGLSLLLLFLFSPERKPKINGQMFFLGAAFMLLETKSVVHMALLFGSTWVVNSAV
ncbi:MAG TPA: hypothetical protein V6D17_11185, partial [Candidatus Obscuribacterales bacterium]